MARKDGPEETPEDVTIEEQTAGTSLAEFTNWRSIGTMADYVKLVGGEKNITLAHEELGDGFHEANKDSLLGQRMILVDWSFHVSDKFSRDGEPAGWVRVRGITHMNYKFWFADGSTGIYEQLRKLTDRTGKREALYVHDGLTVSRYDYTDTVTGDISEAATYYISESEPG